MKIPQWCYNLRAQARDFEIYTERVATLQRLHPELKVERVLWRQPGVLKVCLFRICFSEEPRNHCKIRRS